MKRLDNAIITWLVADSTLVSLTGHSSSDLRIHMAQPDADVKTPECVISILEPTEEIARHVYTSDVRAEIYASSATAAENIQNRLRAMVSDRSTEAKRRRGPDFSDSDIYIHYCGFSSMGSLEWVEDMLIWMCYLEFRLVWHFK